MVNVAEGNRTFSAPFQYLYVSWMYWRHYCFSSNAHIWYHPCVKPSDPLRTNQWKVSHPWRRKEKGSFALASTHPFPFGNSLSHAQVSEESPCQIPPILLSHPRSGSLSLCPEPPPWGRIPGHWSFLSCFLRSFLLSTHSLIFLVQMCPLQKYLRTLTFEKGKRSF